MSSLDHLTAPLVPDSFPYKLARLIIPDPASKDQRWCISFWVYDQQKGKCTRILDRKINRIQDLAERKKHAEKKIRQINQLLRSGHTINRLAMPDPSFSDLTCLAALDSALQTKKKLVNPARKNKKRSSSFEFYKKQLATFKKWMTLQQLTRLPLQAFTAQHAQRFMDYVDSQPWSASTFNHHRSTLQNLFNVLINRDMIHKNPFTKIQPKKKALKKNLPFSPSQIQQVMTFLPDHYPEMLLPCMWVYYTFMRPNEMAHLKISHIGQIHPDQIYLPGQLSKNGMDRHIPIHPDLQLQIQKAQLLQQPPDHYVFSKGFKPGKTFLDPGNFSNRFSARVKKPLQLPDHLTFYNFKHTGVQMAYYSGISKAEIQVIIGHQNNASFESYMQGMGIHDFQDFTTKMPALGSDFFRK